MRNTMKEEEENIGIVKQLYDAYKRHDISSVLDMFTDHAVLHGPAPAGVLPWGGILRWSRENCRFLQSSWRVT
jgi:ketosteroid isomerase-like protein